MKTCIRIPVLPDNLLIEHLENHELLNSLLKKHGISWVNNPELIREFYKQLIESDFYLSYMDETEVSWKSDKNLVLQLLDELILSSDSLETVLEERSIFWNDDLEFVVRMVEKSLKKYPGLMILLRFPVYSLFKDDEDREFVKNLFRNIVLNHKNMKK
jgi:transcription antitermination protein NusB